MFDLLASNSHVSDLYIYVFLFTVIILQRNNEFQLGCAVLNQNLVARQRHLWLVFDVVECGQQVLDVVTLSCE